MGNFKIDEYLPIIMIAAFAVGDILLLKLGLVITKAQKRKRMKWVAGSFAIQFGVVFAISSPLFLLGIIGAFKGGPPPVGLASIVFISAFIDLNIINILHQIGLKRSLVVVIFTFAPIFLMMVVFGMYVSSFFHY